MIGTIGSLVKETRNPGKWARAGGLYITAGASSAAAFGAALWGAGLLIHHTLAVGRIDLLVLHPASAWLVGLTALAYSGSDLGWYHMPRPIIMKAVPVSWWRRWGAYRAALAYGGALGLGVTTQVPFGAFYVLCWLCVTQGSVIYAATLFGAYGLARTVVIFPLSWDIFRRRANTDGTFWWPFLELARARAIVALALMAFGAQTLWVAAGHGLVF